MLLCFMAIGASAKKNGFPTEVAWNFYPDGASYWTLIRPQPEWLTRHRWDPRIEAATNISKDRLLEDGRPLDEVVAKIRKEVASHIVLVEAEQYHSDLLGMIQASCAIILENYTTVELSVPYRMGWLSPTAVKALDITARERLKKDYEPAPSAPDRSLGMLLSFDAATEHLPKMFAALH
jgi:hypothetical protein